MYNYTVKLFKEAFQFNITILNRSNIFYDLEKEPTWKFEVILKGVIKSRQCIFSENIMDLLKGLG